MQKPCLSLQKPFPIPAETMPVSAETTVSLHKPKNVPTVLYRGKTKKLQFMQGQNMK